LKHHHLDPDQNPNQTKAAGFVQWQSPEGEPGEATEEEKGATYSPQKTVAGGVPAILSSLEHTFGEIGFIRGARSLLHLNQKTGFDCPGCAWPDPDKHRSITEFCENGAKAVAEEATRFRITPQFFSAHSIAELSLKSDYWLGKQGRLTHPMIKRPQSSHYEPISWENAFSLIAETLNTLNDPNEATFYTSGRTSNEAAFLYQLFVRLFGTNNLPDCSNMCHESSGVALIESIGFGKGTVTLDDFDKADCILVIGQNPGTNHPRMLTALQSAARKGCQIISINPLQEAGTSAFKHPQEITQLLGNGTPLASLFVPVRINGDVALLKGIMKAMLGSEKKSPGLVFNHDFIQKYTLGYSNFIHDLESTPWDMILSESAISYEMIQEVAHQIMKAKNLIICWAMGLTQHKNAVANIQECINLLLLGGHLGRPGAGACPVRGHSNVQGDRTMGISEKMPDAFMDSLKREFQFDPPRDHGLDTVQSIQAMLNQKVKVFFGLGGNFLSATPDTTWVAQALQRCLLTVQVSTKLNRAHLITGQTALILPCLGRTEIDLQQGVPQFVTVENSMGVVHSSQGSLSPASEFLKSEVSIVCELAHAVFKNNPEKSNKVNWSALPQDYRQIRNHISNVIPGFEAYHERVKVPGGFYLPHPVRDKLEFRTTTGKAHFTVHPIETMAIPSKHYLLMTIRSHDQFNTTIYGLDDRYRGIRQGRRVLFMNAEDIAEASLTGGILVHIQSHFGKETRSVRNFKIVPYLIPRKCVAAYFPEANPLVPLESKADKSNTPTYKSILVTITKASL
jgi:molybdopterin-dependent oxidoreductase alpha subunit